jgi:hypothetical protein
MLKSLQIFLIPIALITQGWAVNTPVLFSFLPDYRRVFKRLWERHKNPISWVCRPFFGLIFCYGAILHSLPILLIGALGMGSSWFWFPKWKRTPDWAEKFINKEYEVLTPENRLDFKRVILPSFGMPLGLAALAVLLWNLAYPWNWVGILVMVILTIFKTIWSSNLEGSVLNPLRYIVLLGFILGTIAGVFIFIWY